MTLKNKIVPLKHFLDLWISKKEVLMRTFTLLLFSLFFSSCNMDKSYKSVGYLPACTMMFVYDTLSVSIALKETVKFDDLVIYINNKEYVESFSSLNKYGMKLSDDNVLSFSLFLQQSNYPYSLHLEILDKNSERIIVSDIYDIRWLEASEPNGEGCGYQYEASLVLTE